MTQLSILGYFIAALFAFWWFDNALEGRRSAYAQDEQQEFPTLAIGYLDLNEDVRYDDWGVHPVDIRSSIAIEDRRGRAGAELGLQDIQQLTRVSKTNFALRAESVADAQEMYDRIVQWQSDDEIEIFVLDAPTAIVEAVSDATKDRGILLFNATAVGDSLRNEHCAAHLLHTTPSRAMRTDAIVQHLVARKWQEVLVLQGPLPEDAATVAAFQRSAELFGVDIEEIRSFVLGSDPRARELNDIDFLTGGGVDYDAVIVADADGEFALSVPYTVRRPAPVMGAAGLVPLAWHWSYMRHGAPQVHGRFERMHGRRMGESDWGAWIAIKAIGEAVVRGKSREAADINAYLRGDRARIDGSKGPGMGFRPWNGQLRQAVLLSSGNWVAVRAPLEGFKHRENDLDTLGYDARDSRCTL